MKKCDVEGCENPSRSKKSKWCEKHFARFYRHGDPNKDPGLRNPRTKHPLIKTRVIDMPAYKSWRSMRRRCLDKKSIRYENYGGRGIKICDRWDSFVNFLNDMGLPPPGCQIDRIDNNGNYEPANCRWASVKQNSNNRRSNVYLEIDGERLTVAQWAEKIGIKSCTITMRLRRGYSATEAISVKALPKKRNRTN